MHGQRLGEVLIELHRGWSPGLARVLAHVQRTAGCPPVAPATAAGGQVDAVGVLRIHDERMYVVVEPVV